MPVQPDLEYHRYLAAGRFMLPADRNGAPFFPPRATVPRTASADVTWVEASGRGMVYSATTVHKRPPEASYNISLVELEEGPRMMSRVEGINPQDVRIGMAVIARIRTQSEGDPYIIFEPDTAA